MSHLIHDLFAKIQSNPGRLLICSSIISGKPFFKYSRKIFCLNTDSIILDHQTLPSSFFFQTDSDLAAILCVFQSIRQNLFCHKLQPFFICKNYSFHRPVIQTDLLKNKHLRIFPDRLFQNLIQRYLLKLQIPGHIFHAEIRQHHLHILFHFKKFHLHLF